MAAIHSLPAFLAMAGGRINNENVLYARSEAKIPEKKPMR